MSVYLDSGVIIALLYADTDSPAKAQSAARFFEAIQENRVSALVSFYMLPELYSYVQENYDSNQVSEIFRTSLINLFRFPLVVKPFVERGEFERLRRTISIRDSYDKYHVAAAQYFNCSAIITFDHHFQQVRDLITVFSPDEYLATLTDTDGE